MPKIHVVVASRSRFDFMLSHYRFYSGQFLVKLNEILFSGSDVKSFLQAQSTFDIELVKNGSFQLISFLDPQGRVECFGWLVYNKTYSFLFPPTLSEKTLNRLNKFLVSEDVSISDIQEKEVIFALGPEVSVEGISGIMFDERAVLTDQVSPGIDLIPAEEVETWRALTGWPKFDGSDYSYEILNNLRLFDLAFVPNKGCFPGQETVSKIATRRGAAYSPVLIQVNLPSPTGDVTSYGKKIGTASSCYHWDGKYYISASLLRDFRVEKMLLQFTINEMTQEGIVCYYPLIHGDSQSKAKELFYDATEDFKMDSLQSAEIKFRLAIKLDPTFADAYESLGVMLGRLGRFEEAIDLMNKLSEVDDKSILAHTNMSLYLMKMGKIAEAEEQKSLATIKSFQSFGHEAKRKEAEASLKDKQLKEWAQRENMFKQVLEIDPDDTLANYGLGSIAVEKGDWSAGFEYLKRVIKQDPKYSVAYVALGKALKGLGDLKEARNIWSEGIKISAAKGDLMPANQMQQLLFELPIDL
jgi:tetratricopeptide (TPR) repeat protein